MADEVRTAERGQRVTWTRRAAKRPYDKVFSDVTWQVLHRRFAYTTDECLRILAASGFRDPVFEWASQGLVRLERCLLVGPDGERHDGATILALIFKAAALEHLCKDRGDAVLAMLRRGGEG